MADQAIMGALAQRKQLEAKLAECEAKIKRIRAQLSETNKFISQWEKFSGQSALDLGDQLSLAVLTNPSQNDTDSTATGKVRNPKKETVAKIVAEILDSAGAPMSRADIFKALTDRGIRILGENPEMVLSTMLWRAGEEFHIERLKGGGYWFSDRPIPADDPPPSKSIDEYNGEPDPDLARDAAAIDASLRETE